MKNRYFAALALAGLVSFAACGGEEAEVEDTLVTDTMSAPITPEPVITDTGTVMVDSGLVDTTTVTP